MHSFSIKGTHAPLASELSYKVTSSLRHSIEIIIMMLLFFFKKFIQRKRMLNFGGLNGEIQFSLAMAAVTQLGVLLCYISLKGLY